MTTPAPFGRPDDTTAALLAARRADDDRDALDAVVGYARGLFARLDTALSTAEADGDAVALQNVLSDVATAAGDVSRELCKGLGWETS